MIWIHMHFNHYLKYTPMYLNQTSGMAPRKMATMNMSVTHIKTHQNIQVVSKTTWQTTTSLKEDSFGQEEKNKDKK